LPTMLFREFLLRKTYYYIKNILKKEAVTKLGQPLLKMKVMLSQDKFGIPDKFSFAVKLTDIISFDKISVVIPEN